MDNKSAVTCVALAISFSFDALEHAPPKNAANKLAKTKTSKPFNWLTSFKPVLSFVEAFVVLIRTIISLLPNQKLKLDKL